MKEDGKTMGLQRTDYSEWAIILLAIGIGVFAGLFSVLFRIMIGWAKGGFYGTGQALLGFMPGEWWKVFVPAIAGIVVGPLTYFLAREAKGHGVPEVMETVALRGARMRMRVIFVKALASASSIGAGASVGREGPIVQMGSGIGSIMAQWFKLHGEKVKTSVGCGAASGIAATFNAPIAGVIFAQEVILGKFTPTTFVPIVVSSVTASVVARIFVGDIPAFIVQSFTLNHPYELILYLLLGVLSAFTAVIFVKSLYLTEDIFDSWKGFPEWLKPVFGGLIIGLMGMGFPQILGVGYETIQGVFQNETLMGVLIVLVFLKILATSITLGSGHSGGVFAPCLFIGASLGGAFGLFVKQLFPTLVGHPGAYAIVGMGAVVAGATQAPITAVLIIFEMTRDYRLILPLMIAIVFSTFIYSYLSRGSIYTLKLLRRGIDLEAGKDINIMKRIKVGDVMTSPVEVVRLSDHVGRVIEIMHHSKHNGFPVINEKGELHGIITLQDVREAPVKGIMELPVKKIMTTTLKVTYPHELLDNVFRMMRKFELGHLPVVTPDDPNKLVGIITRSDLLKAYDKSLVAK